MMVRRPVSPVEFQEAIALICRGELSPADIRATVRTTLRWLAQVHPGHTVEIRVPPHAAVQAIEGPRHTRGTPPNVVETDGQTWLALVTGQLSWPQALAQGKVRASGLRADLDAVLPMVSS